MKKENKLEMSKALLEKMGITNYMIGNPEKENCYEHVYALINTASVPMECIIHLDTICPELINQVAIEEKYWLRSDERIHMYCLDESFVTDTLYSNDSK